MTTQTYTSTLTIIDCGVCCVAFGLETSMYKRVLRTGDWLAYPALSGVDRRLTTVLERRESRCLHHVHGCPATCELREVSS